MDTKKVVVIVVLVVVIVVAAVFTAKRTSGKQGSAALEAAQKGQIAAKVDKIDNKTLEVFSETLSDWKTKYAPDAEGHFKNPKTGEYTMVGAMKCASCGADIPYPDLPAELLGSKGKGARRGGNPEARMEQILANYMCPKCGKHAYFATGER